MSCAPPLCDDLHAMADYDGKPSTETFFASQAELWHERYESRTYRERRELIRQLIRAEIKRAARPCSEIAVLDFGCGGGIMVRDLLELGLKVTAVDGSREMIEKARSHLGNCGERLGLEWLADGSGEGNYLNQTYDIVLCTSVLEFVPNVELLTARLAAVLRAGGILIASVPNRESSLRRGERFMYKHPRLFRHLPVLSKLAVKRAYLDIEKHQFSLAELARMFERAGLRLQEHRYHVAPAFLHAVENSASTGMMLTGVFRKNARSASS